MPSVLIVDDLISIHEMLEAVIQPTGFSTAFATDGEKALTRYKAEKFDMVLADIDMKPMDGITLLKQLKQYDPNSVTIIMTAYASTESAVQALKFGAFDYLQKPFRVDELIATLRRGIEFREIQAQRATVPAGTGVKAADIEGRLVGKSAQITKLIQQVKKLGSLGGILSLLPGMPKELKQAKDSIDDRQLVQVEAIIQSMTKKERSDPDLINGSRRKRIAAGAGVDVSEVNKLLKMHRQMSDMMKKMGKGGRMPQMPGGMPGGFPPGIFPGRR